MRLIFIRHGQTTGDVEDRYGGWYDDLLSPHGEQQATELADELANSGIEKIFASDLKRAQQTAHVLSIRTKCPVVTIPNLKERNNNGPLTGLTKAEARERYPDLIEQVKNRLHTVQGSESYDVAKNRMTDGYNTVLSQTQKCSAIVWHGGGMRVLFREITKMGELKEIGDCAWVELEQSEPGNSFTIKQAKRLVFDF